MSVNLQFERETLWYQRGQAGVTVEYINRLEKIHSVAKMFSISL